MTRSTLWQDPSAAWSAYDPAGHGGWTRAHVIHLHRRAGFQADRSVLDRDLEVGPEAAVARLIRGDSESLDGMTAASFAAFQDQMNRTLSVDADANRLQSIWLYRMIHTPRPLVERMTLFWHDHFATSIEKVEDAALMARQNELFRREALGSFAELLHAIAQDPAMLIYLDATNNRKAEPNENFAREVMELFSLGLGHYAERDVREAARAFTGGFVINKRFRMVTRQHDSGTKTVLGRKGEFRGGDVVDVLLDQPACARFICSKLVRMFISDVDDFEDAFVEPIAAAFRDSGYRIEVPVRMILRSRLFHDPANRRKRVKSPVEHAVGTIRSLEVISPTVEQGPLADALALMGQELYAPPNVSGWDGGRAWINTTRLLARTNFVLGLLSTDDEAFGGRLDPAELAARHGISDVTTFLSELLDIPTDVDGPVPDGLDADRAIAARFLTAPTYQLG